MQLFGLIFGFVIIYLFILVGLHSSAATAATTRSNFQQPSLAFRIRPGFRPPISSTYRSSMGIRRCHDDGLNRCLLISTGIREAFSK